MPLNSVNHCVVPLSPPCSSAFTQTDWPEAEHPDCSKQFYISRLFTVATKPVAWQEQGHVDSLDEWVNESRYKVEWV